MCQYGNSSGRGRHVLARVHAPGCGHQRSARKRDESCRRDEHRLHAKRIRKHRRREQRQRARHADAHAHERAHAAKVGQLAVALGERHTQGHDHAIRCPEDELTGGSLALVVRSRADRLARSVGPDTLPYPLLCDADGVLYDLLDIPTRSGALSTYSLEAWQIMREAKRQGYQAAKGQMQQLPLTLILDKDGTVLFSHYGASLTDVPADCGAAQSLLEDLDVAKPVDVDDADVTIYADPGAAPDIPGLTPHVHEYAQPNLGETGVFSVFDDAYKDEE